MSVSAITSAASTPEPAWSRSLGSPLGMPTVRDLPAKPAAADVRKAAGQFEAIILRQLLAPSIEPMMNGGLGGKESSGGGGGVYSYLLTDVLCSSISNSGGLGLGRVLEKQLAPSSADASADPDSKDL